MNNEQKQRALQMLRRFEQADPRTRQADNAAVDMAALLHDLVDAPEQAGVPEGWKLAPIVATVDMKNAGADELTGLTSYAMGTARKVYAAMLAAAPQAPAVQADMVSADDLAKLLPYGYYMDQPDGGSPTVLEQVARMAEDAERYRWLRFALSDKSKNGKSHHFCSIQRGHPEELDDAIDAAIAAEKGGPQ